jgi:hypothetical protein
LAGESVLSHRLPAATAVITPGPAAVSVPVGGLTISWRAVAGVTSYVVGVKQRESGPSITARLPASSTSFVVPAGFLLPGTKYQVEIGVLSPEGNISYIESTFATETP